MTIIEMANELGKMLAESEEFKRLKAADEAQRTDEAAQLMLMAYNKRREELMAQAQKEDITDGEIQKIRAEMDAEFAKLNKSPVIMEFVEAMSRFNNLMGNVNTRMAAYVSPKNESDCGSECGSCGGCN